MADCARVMFLLDLAVREMYTISPVSQSFPPLPLDCYFPDVLIGFAVRLALILHLNRQTFFRTISAKSLLYSRGYLIGPVLLASAFFALDLNTTVYTECTLI